MNSLILLSILLSAALGIARGADLAFGTDAVTGLCTVGSVSVSYTHLRAHETGRNLVCRLLLEKKNKPQ